MGDIAITGVLLETVEAVVEVVFGFSGLETAIATVGATEIVTVVEVADFVPVEVVVLIGSTRGLGAEPV